MESRPALHPRQRGRPRVLIYCQSMVGLGHLVRGAALADALAESAQVCLISGGAVEAVPRWNPSVRSVQLAPLRRDFTRALSHPLDYEEDIASFISLDPGVPAAEAMEARKQRIVEEVLAFEPDVIITEFYPLARWTFGAELLPAIDLARAQGAKIVCSVRDVVKPMDPDSPWRAKLGGAYEEGFQRYYQRTVAMLNARYDALFVHSDEAVMRLSESLPNAGDIGIPVIHTGYLSTSLDMALSADTYARDAGNDAPAIVLSAGGGFGEVAFLEHWLAALAVVRGKELGECGKIVAVTGPLLEADSYARLKAVGARHAKVTVKRYSSDFQALMDGASLSVSRAGYNTAYNILRSPTPALVVPASHLSDQKLRALRFGALGIAACGRRDDTLEDSARLAAATLRQPRALRGFDTGGAARTREAVETLLGMNA